MIEFINPIIAAVRTDEQYKKALESDVSAVFMLKADMLTIADLIKDKKDKKVFVHIDMAEGIGKDKKGIEVLKRIGVDGIITTKNHLISCAKELGLITVQRFFIIDSGSVATALESVSQTKPDFAELMPGVIPKAIKGFIERANVPIISGGLIEDKNDVIGALSAGAEAVSTGKQSLWNEQ